MSPRADRAEGEGHTVLYLARSTAGASTLPPAARIFAK